MCVKQALIFDVIWLQLLERYNVGSVWLTVQTRKYVKFKNTRSHVVKYNEVSSYNITPYSVYVCVSITI